MTRSSVWKVGMLAAVFTLGYTALVAAHGGLRRVFLRWGNQLAVHTLPGVDVYAPADFPSGKSSCFELREE
jgi:hypothetical protein